MIMYMSFGIFRIIKQTVAEEVSVIGGTGTKPICPVHLQSYCLEVPQGHLMTLNRIQSAVHKSNKKE